MSAKFNRREFLGTTLAGAGAAGLAAGAQLGGTFETEAMAQDSRTILAGWRLIGWGKDNTFAHRQDAIALLHRHPKHECFRTSDAPPEPDPIFRLGNDFRWKKHEMDPPTAEPPGFGQTQAEAWGYYSSPAMRGCLERVFYISYKQDKQDKERKKSNFRLGAVGMRISGKLSDEQIKTELTYFYTKLTTFMSTRTADFHISDPPSNPSDPLRQLYAVIEKGFSLSPSQTMGIISKIPEPPCQENDIEENFIRVQKP